MKILKRIVHMLTGGHRWFYSHSRGRLVCPSCLATRKIP